MESNQWQQYLPLTETTYYILLALLEPLHGYIVMQRVQEMSRGSVEVGPGTLYGAFSKLLQEGLVRMVKEDNRRKVYELTPKGKDVVRAQIGRLEIMTQAGLDVIEALRSTGDME
ncbi:MAG TPA: PadR family transcriptional regulator [Anaerolineae bacterium]|nr:PadR family transcriptional regulator [Anaerolineae bacterium]